MNTSIYPLPIAPFTLETFKEYFSSIPSNRWIVGDRDNGHGGHCALGHTCKADGYAWGSSSVRGPRQANTEATDALITLFGLFVGEELISTSPYPFILNPIHAVTSINNGYHPSYQQPDPRARILAAIDDLITKRDWELDTPERRSLVEVTKPELVAMEGGA